LEEFVPLRELISLDGKGAVVTGGGMGIGLAICRRLAEAGEAEAQNACAELASAGNDVRFIKCDVTSEDDVKAMVSGAAGVLGGIDILVNNAGVYPRKPLEAMTGRDFEEVVSINLTGTFLCSRYAAAKMMKREGGSIINMASIEAVHPSSSGMSAYGASKGGVLMLTKNLARELGPHGIRVNAVAPGGIKTQGLLSQITGPRDRAQLKEFKSFLSRIALDRLGDADEVARVVLFLASDMSAYVTGDLIVVDGGYLVS
jgi:NAD(P)-dependent dehydrogenase (short-subunit alcohol dehydrogenase family)